MKTILFLDDDPERHTAFKKQYDTTHKVTYVWDADQCIKALQDNPQFDVWSLDHDLGREVYVAITQANTGSGVCRWIVENLPPEKFAGDVVVIHSWNRAGAHSMAGHLRTKGIRPFWQMFNPKNGPNTPGGLF